jgi:hypothetical protein
VGILWIPCSASVGMLHSHQEFSCRNTCLM